jgi:hypothetical protein
MKLTTSRLASMDIDDLFDAFDCRISPQSTDRLETAWPVVRNLENSYSVFKQQCDAVNIDDRYHVHDTFKLNVVNDRTAINLAVNDNRIEPDMQLVREVKASFGLKLKMLADERMPLADVTNQDMNMAGHYNQIQEHKRASKLPPKPTDRSSKEVLATNLLAGGSYRGRRRFDKWNAGDRSVSIAYNKQDQVEKLSRSLEQRDKSQNPQNENFLKFMQDLKKKSIFDGIIEKPKKNSIVLHHEPLFNTSKYETDVTYDKIKNYLSTNRELRGVSARSRDVDLSSNNYRNRRENKQYAIFEDYPLTATTHNPSSTSRLKNITSFRERICKKEDGQPDESSYSRRMYMNASLLDSSRPILPRPVSKFDPRKRAPSLSYHNMKGPLEASKGCDESEADIGVSHNIYMGDLSRINAKTGRAQKDLSRSRNLLLADSHRYTAGMPKGLMAKIAVIVNKKTTLK